MYSRKSVIHSSKIHRAVISVEFLIVPSTDASSPDNTELTEEDLKCLEYAAHGIRLAAKIVDTPCNEMNVDHFLEVC